MSTKATPWTVGRWCLSEDECIEQRVNFAGYERGVEDAARALEDLARERDKLASRVAQLESAALAAQPDAGRPVDATATEWKDAVWRAYMVLRRNDNTIPSEWLDFMREKLLAATPSAPTAEHKPLFAELIAAHPGLLEEMQAESVKPRDERAEIGSK